MLCQDPTGQPTHISLRKPTLLSALKARKTFVLIYQGVKDIVALVCVGGLVMAPSHCHLDQAEDHLNCESTPIAEV